MGQNCAFMHNCYNNCAYMHGYCSICISYFSIFFLFHPLFFSLSPLTLTSFVFSHLIPLASTIADRHQSLADQHHTTHCLIKSPSIALPSLSVFLIWSRSNHCRRSTRWSISNHCCTNPDQIVTSQLADFSLFDQWISGWVGFWSWIGLILSGSPIEYWWWWWLGLRGRERQRRK